ncbi:MAG: sulfurtransferase TusA family protein [Candidatus Methanofastidiosia archaeon]
MKYTLKMFGEICPYPLISAQKKYRELKVGDELELFSDCPLTEENVLRWAEKEGIEVLSSKKIGNAEWKINLKKVK